MKKSVKFKENIVYTIILVLYIILTTVMTFKHEAWFDETQAWNIARDSSPGEIVEIMKYEGHSSLWHFILYPFAHSGLPFETIGIISVFFMSLSVFLLLFKSPFPMYMKLLIILSSGFIYINVTVSRVYCIIPLVLFLTAMVYPKRFEKPVLYGLLIAVLCNTHPMMCGTVGILGIYMLIDLSDSLKKQSTNHKNIFKQVTGLIIAGAGVIVFLLQISQSIFSNEIALAKDYNIFNCMNFMQWTNNLYQFKLFVTIKDGIMTTGVFIVEIILYLITVVGIILILFLLRKSQRLVIMILFSMFFQIFVNCVLWVYNANRAHISLLTIIFFLWIAFNQGFDFNISIKTDEVLLKIRIFKKLFSLDKYNKKIMSCIISFICVLTIPTSIYYIINDYKYPFTGAKQMTEYINNNLPENSKILTTIGSSYVVSAYNPDIKLFNLHREEYQTFTYHSGYDDDIEEFEDGLFDKILKNFPDKSKVYYITAVINKNLIPENDARIKKIYETDYSIRFPNRDHHYCYALFEVYPDEIRKYNEQKLNDNARLFSAPAV